jgi:hypothetical protein
VDGVPGDANCIQSLGDIALAKSDPAARAAHVQAAREAWLSVDRADLIQKLDSEFAPMVQPPDMES